MEQGRRRPPSTSSGECIHSQVSDAIHLEHCVCCMLPIFSLGISSVGIVCCYCRYLTESYGASSGIIEQRIVEGETIATLTK